MVDIDLPNEDQLDKDLAQLTREQEKLLAQLQRAYAEEDAELHGDLETERKANLDAEMKALAMAISSSVSPTDVDSAIEKMKEVYFIIKTY